VGAHRRSNSQLTATDPPRVGFDGSALRRQGKGAERVQTELLKAFAELESVPELVVFVPAEADQPELPHPPGWRYVKMPMRPLLLWEQLGLPRAARRERLDLVLSTSERAALFGVPQSVFIFEHPRHRQARQRESGISLRQRAANLLTTRLFAVSMRRARQVTAASKSTAADMAGTRVADVIYLGVGREFSPDAAGAAAARTRADASEGYFLHLASDDPREDNETVLEALGRLAAGGHHPILVVAGGARTRLPVLQELAAQLGVDGQVRWLGFQSEADLIDLYRGAIAYIDSSLYEGLPLQPLESMACGTPTITSDVTSFPELVGDAGLLVPAGDVDGFAAAMLRVLEDPALLVALRGAARLRAAEFSWQATASAWLDASLAAR
jgi:glycosyltransferase involved in cell wall biosynthesis